MTARRVTIRDVAELANVSVATVSKVINDRYGVSRETSKRVKLVIDELGYESSLVARSLRTTRTGVLGVLVSDVEPFTAELLKGVARGLRGTGYELIVYSAGGKSLDHVGWENRALSRLGGTLIDGAILVTPTVVGPSFGPPVVAVDPHTGSDQVSTVDSDNRHGACLATQHLLDLGHRRIGFVGGRADLESARLRELGYTETMRRAGLEPERELVASGTYEDDEAQRAAVELLSLAAPPTAVFAANDRSAIAVVREALRRGLRVPEDLSVVGFDNVPESALSKPALTTVNQPIQEMGERAVEILIGMLSEQVAEVVHETLPTHLVERRSCAPPPPVVPEPASPSAAERPRAGAR